MVTKKQQDKQDLHRSKMNRMERLRQIKRGMPPKRKGQDEYISPQYRKWEYCLETAIEQETTIRRLREQLRRLRIKHGEVGG